MSRASLVLRSLFLLGFVLAMPLLALPSVARWADDFLYGDSPREPADTAPVKEDRTSADEQRDVMQAVLETPLPGTANSSASDSHSRGLDSVPAQPPEMPPNPEFPSSPVDHPESTLSPTLDLQFDPSSFTSGRPQGSGPGTENARAALPTRIGEIRERLEDLGAEYIRLELAGGEFHCQCRMLMAKDSAETKLFAASGKDVTAVAEQVLESVEAWRASGTIRSPVE